jgi:hypothetical protein
MAFFLFRERTMDTTPEKQPVHPTDAKPSPVRVTDLETPEARKRRLQTAPEPHQSIDEPGYGHGV